MLREKRYILVNYSFSVLSTVNTSSFTSDYDSLVDISLSLPVIHSNVVKLKRVSFY